MKGHVPKLRFLHLVKADVQVPRADMVDLAVIQELSPTHLQFDRLPRGLGDVRPDALRVAPLEIEDSGSGRTF